MKPRLFCYFLLFSSLSCADFGPDTALPRIIPGVSVDGVKIGMSWEEVVGLLGEGYGIGGYDAAPQAGYILGYLSGEHAGLSLWFPEWNGGAWGAAIHIEMDESYKGRTREGVGIGSTRDEVRRAFGEPESFAEREGAPYWDAYRLNGRGFSIRYALGKVARMSF